jgi:two-component system sensor histidine kinase BaeS
MTMRSRIALGTVLAALVGVAAAGLVALGLVRHAYDGQARATLHREAVLAASALENTGRLAPVRALRAVGVRVVWVHADGSGAGQAVLDPADVATAQAGGTASQTRRLNGVRYLVEVQPVAGDGGVVLAQRLADARAVSSGVLRKLFLALLIGLGAAVAIGVAVARRLSEPLVHAAGAAHRLAAGDRSVRLAEQGPEEVSELSRSLNALAQALATSEGRQREFLLSVSHELRTPLTGIRGFAEAIEEGVADPAEAARTIGVEADRMQRLVSDLLDLARAEADDFRLDLAPVDLVEIVRAAVPVWEHRCAEVGVAFSAELPPYPVVVQADAGRLRQVLDGLAENALRVTPEDRPIVFAVQAPGVLQVRDGGPGLAPEDLPVAFDRSVLYERYQGVRRVGTGLGLALVGALVRRMGGTAEAGRAPEGGACFSVRLPSSGGS